MQFGEDAMAGSVGNAEAWTREPVAAVASGTQVHIVTLLPPPLNSVKNPSEVGLSSLSLILGTALIQPSSASASRAMSATTCAGSSTVNSTRSISRRLRATVRSIAAASGPDCLPCWSRFEGVSAGPTFGHHLEARHVSASPLYQAGEDQLLIINARRKAHLSSANREPPRAPLPLPAMLDPARSHGDK